MYKYGLGCSLLYGFIKTSYLTHNVKIYRENDKVSPLLLTERIPIVLLGTLMVPFYLPYH